MNFCLIGRADEYRLARVTDTHACNLRRHGWTVVRRWHRRPTRTAVTEAAYLHQISSNQPEGNQP